MSVYEGTCPNCGTKLRVKPKEEKKEPAKKPNVSDNVDPIMDVIFGDFLSNFKFQQSQ